MSSAHWRPFCPAEYELTGKGPILQAWFLVNSSMLFHPALSNGYTYLSILGLSSLIIAKGCIRQMLAYNVSKPKSPMPSVISVSQWFNIVEVILVICDDVIKWKHFSRYWLFVRGTGEFPAQRPVTRSSDVFYDLRLNKRLSKQSWGW